MLRKDVVDFLKEYEEFRPEIIERDLEITPSIKFITSIIGPRRAGKTYYLLHLREKFKKPLYLNFEDTRLMDTKGKELREIIRIFMEIYGASPDVLLLDEVQNLPEWEGVLRELHDLKKYPIVVTGSSSRLLAREIATQLRGRTLTYILLPFSFTEFCKAKKIIVNDLLSRDEEAKFIALLREYLQFGGFPDVVLSEDKLKILKEYSDLILFRDFIERHEIRNLSLARHIFSFITQNFSKEISVNSLYNRFRSSGLRVSKDTIYEYLEKLEDTLFVFFLQKYSLKVHMRESYPKKVYVCDTGITRVTRFSEDLGKLMENAVFLELRRRENANPLQEIYYFKDAQQYEVDFVVKEGTEVKQLIQVCYASSFDEVEHRELRALLRAKDVLNCRNLIVITWDYEGTREIRWFGRTGKIRFVPLWKWLLNINFP